MKSKLLLKLTCQSPVTARRLAAVLGPDNRGFPSGQRFSMAVKSRFVKFSVESERLPSAFTTILGVLRDVALFQEIWLISRAMDA